MGMEQRAEQSISWSKVSYCRNDNICRKGSKMVKFSETERKQRMDISSLMEQILSNENLNQGVLTVNRNIA